MNEIVAHTEHAPALPQQSDAVSMLNIIARASADPNTDVVKLQALLDMQERVLARQAEASFNAALQRATLDMPRVKKNGRVELGEKKGGYDFAKWEDMDNVIRPIMQREGFTLSFDMTARADGGGAVVHGTLRHKEGHSKTVTIPLALDTGAGRNNLQAMGSTLSYGKRYCAEMLFNIVREGADDDGRTGGMECVTASELAQLQELAETVGADLQRFCHLMGVESLAHIERRDFTRAVNALNMKKGQKQQ